MFEGMMDRLEGGLDRIPGKVGLDTSSYSGSGLGGHQSLDSL